MAALEFLAACGSSSSPSGPPATVNDAALADVAADVAAPLETSTVGDAGSPEASSTGDAATDASTTASDAGMGCARTPAAADRARFLVASHPFAVDGGTATTFEVLSLSETGTLARPATPVTFSMGPASNAPVLFTSDGQVGLVAQDDGTIGVFRLDASGAPSVVNAGYRGAFYASQLTLSADGSHVYALDPDTASNHGGVYELAIACDGTLSGERLVIPGGTAYVMALLPSDPTRALLSAGAAFNAPASADTELVDLASPSLLASTQAFSGDAGASIPSSVAIAPDGKFALIADDSVAAGNQMAVVALSASNLTPVGVLSTPYPTAVVISPFDNAALVLNDDSTDQIHVLTYDPSSPTAPFVITGQLAYRFPPPQIPVTASLISRGMLEGTVFVGENTAVRQVTFTASGQVNDTAQLVFPGSAFDTIVGVVGVQP